MLLLGFLTSIIQETMNVPHLALRVNLGQGQWHQSLGYCTQTKQALSAKTHLSETWDYSGHNGGLVLGLAYTCQGELFSFNLSYLVCSPKGTIQVSYKCTLQTKL